MIRDKYVMNCPYCGGAEMVEAIQSGYAGVAGVDNMWGGMPLYYAICRNCGSVVRSYVKEPEKLLKKKDRKSEF